MRRPWIDMACISGSLAAMGLEYAVLRHPVDASASDFPSVEMSPLEILKNDKFPMLVKLYTSTARVQDEIVAHQPGLKIMAGLDRLIELVPRAAGEVAEGEVELRLRRQVLIAAADTLGTFAAFGSEQRERAKAAIKAAQHRLLAGPIDGRLLPEMMKTFPDLERPSVTFGPRRAVANGYLRSPD